MWFLVLSLLSVASVANRWSPDQIVQYMRAHPQRAYFSRLFRDGGFRSGMEIGVAAGRFSEHMLIDNEHIGPWQWYMMEPFPNQELIARYPFFATGGLPPKLPASSWITRRIGVNARKTAIVQMSNTMAAHRAFNGTLDFIYLDGAHDYLNVKKELLHYWHRITPGGVLAGHDYCHYPRRGLTSLPKKCTGCLSIPTCGVYTEYVWRKLPGGASSFPGSQAKAFGRPVADQAGVVLAVQEFMSEHAPAIFVHHTAENFTRESLAADGMNYNLIITSTRSPS
mmetsp:Transcript_5110/g.15112  ORF Transcript_5110/g.15112 Transcript_5110/m.15112 type:complete len:281 (-) Transcript_5110:515-1357(-)